MNARRFIRAVLAPHHAEDAEFGQGRLAAEPFQNALVLVLRQTVVLNTLGRDGSLFRFHKELLFSHVAGNSWRCAAYLGFSHGLGSFSGVTASSGGSVSLQAHA